MNFEDIAQKIEQQLAALTGQLRAEIKELGSAHNETLQKIAELKMQLGQAQKQIDAVDRRTQEQATNLAPRGSIKLAGNDSFERLMRDKRGTAVLHVTTQDLLERRTTITSAGFSVAPQRLPGIVPEARRQLRIRDLLTSIPTTSNAVEFVRISGHTRNAAPQAEGTLKAEDEITFQLVTVPVRTIASITYASKQVLDDAVELQETIETSLRYAIEAELEEQLLLGSGTGENINGLVTQGTAFDTSLLGSSYTRIDVIGRAIQQIVAADQEQPDFCVLHPADAWSIRQTKDANRQYIFGAPLDGGLTSIFGLQVVQSTAMTPGQFLVGSSSPNVVQIRMRQEATVEMSTEHADLFARNAIALRAELRAALVVMQPGAFVKGNLTESV